MHGGGTIPQSWGLVPARCYDAGMRRLFPLRRLGLASASLGAVVGMLAFAGTAAATDDERGRPWARGTWTAGFGPGLGFGPDLTQLDLNVGGRYFVVHGLAVGLSLGDTIFIYSSALKADFPGIQKRLPNNVFRIVPHLQYVFFRNRWFSPYVTAGVGPAFMNHGGGTHGYWRASPGAYIGLGKSGLFLDIGVQFDGMFPIGRCRDAMSDAESMIEVRGVCTFGWGPRIGLVGAFGKRSAPRRRTAPPPSNPLPETSEPVAPPVEPTPPPTEPPPTETAPVEPPQVPPEDAPVPVGPAPAEPPPPGPASETAPVEGPPNDPAAPERTPDPIPPPPL